ncbi:SlyX family protein [Candidatus Thiothrix sp. Deng01]|uniref:SlyX family protein n=2 Tax=Thiothrix TaxID=1030 RepID=A0A7L6ATP2_9GAMM|nr:SlyX family protein [Candidatus Thiothrix sp. Deng01]MEB4591809.1 SlyX family protein [Candidatus Thiothrix sp. Deng01]QLQ32486.1 MAG: SlyX family protein [Candidatus Thiothrix singaporensis]
MEERLEKLELLFMQQEQTIEILSRQLYLQQQDIRRALLEIERLNDKLKALEPSAVASRAEETPPPHY